MESKLILAFGSAFAFAAALFVAVPLFSAAVNAPFEAQAAATR